MAILRKIGNAFKWVGSKVLWVIRRKETLIAVSLADDFLPIPALDKIILLVKHLDKKDVPGSEKLAEALEEILPILEEYGIKVSEESDLRFLIELAVKIMKEKARVIAAGDEE